MIAVTIVNTLVVLFCFLMRKNNAKSSFLISTIILTIFYSLRFDYGNDYNQYLGIFRIVNDSSESSQYQVDVIEWGWVLLNRVFGSTGFFSLIIAITAFQFYSFYYVVQKYIKPEQYYIALFFYLFSCGLMLTMLSMMRQALAMNIILISIPFLFDRKYWAYTLMVLIAAQFHQTAYIMLAMPLTLLLFKLTKKQYIIIFALIFITAFIAESFIDEQIGIIIDSMFNKYEAYEEMDNDSKLTKGFGFFLNIVFFATMFVYDRHNNTYQSWFIKNMAFSYLFLPLSFIIQLIGRFGLYFNLIGVLGLCSLVEYSKSKLPLKMIMCIFTCITLYNYYLFFHSDVWIDKYMEFHTIFEASGWL